MIVFYFVYGELFCLFTHPAATEKHNSFVAVFLPIFSPIFTLFFKDLFLDFKFNEPEQLSRRLENQNYELKNTL